MGIDMKYNPFISSTNVAEMDICSKYVYLDIVQAFEYTYSIHVYRTYNIVDYIYIIHHITSTYLYIQRQRATIA